LNQNRGTNRGLILRRKDNLEILDHIKLLKKKMSAGNAMFNNLFTSLHNPADLGHGFHFIPGIILEGSVVLSVRFFAVCEYHVLEGSDTRIFL
jgi:hypothetical protein